MKVDSIQLNVTFWKWPLVSTNSKQHPSPITVLCTAKHSFNIPLNPKDNFLTVRAPITLGKGIYKEKIHKDGKVTCRLCQCFLSDAPSIFVHLCVFGENLAKFYHQLLKFYWAASRKSTHLLQDYSTDSLYGRRKLAFAKYNYNLLSLYLSFLKGHNSATCGSFYIQLHFYKDTKAPFFLERF